MRLPHEQHRDTTVDVHTEIDVRLGARLSTMSRTGLVIVMIGAVLVSLCLLFFAYAFPAKLFAFTVSKATARVYIEMLVTGLGVGTTLVLFGSTLFFYGRSVLGHGRALVDRREQTIEGREARADAPEAMA